MPEKPVPPGSCKSMAQVREGVDAIDRALLELLATRFGYMQAAARIKSDRQSVRDEGRKAQVIANARQIAEEIGLPVDLVTELWERLVEGSIAYEFNEWDKFRS